MGTALPTTQSILIDVSVEKNSIVWSGSKLPAQI